MHSQLRNHVAFIDGAIAQLVEQRTENPCVPGSIPGGTTPPFISPVRENGRVFLFLKGNYNQNRHLRKLSYLYFAVKNKMSKFARIIILSYYKI